jgi:hypothetical protein
VSKNVDLQKVLFKNSYGITLAGDLYLPKNRVSRRLSALAVGGPFGAVKERSSGLYAHTMAGRGFVTLAFDGSCTGESSGEPAMSPCRTLMPMTSASPLTISACILPSTASELALSGICTATRFLGRCPGTLERRSLCDLLPQRPRP